MNDKPTHWWQRPSGRFIAEVDVLCVLAIVAIMVSPSLAATLIPIPLTNYVIDLGDVPPWIAAFVISITWWEARTARKNAAKAQAAATTSLAHIEVVRAQTDGLLDKVAAMSKAEGVATGHKVAIAEVAAAKVVARDDEIADAKTAAEIKAIKEIPTSTKS